MNACCQGKFIQQGPCRLTTSDRLVNSTMVLKSVGYIYCHIQRNNKGSTTSVVTSSTTVIAPYSMPKGFYLDIVQKTGGGGGGGGATKQK